MTTKRKQSEILMITKEKNASLSELHSSNAVDLCGVSGTYSIGNSSHENFANDYLTVTKR